MAAKKRGKGAPLIERRKMARYLYPLDVWAIAFGCSIGWGAFIMPATTFLPLAGSAGTLISMLLSTALMLVIGYNYAWLMKKRPYKGGVYSYTKEAFGRDHAFLCSWFLSLSYLTIVFLNATALFIISRVIFDGLPQISFHYMFAGHTIYPGEIALSVGVLVLIGALLIWEKPLMQEVQRILALLLLAGALILTLVSLPHFQWGDLLTAFAPAGMGAAEAGPAGALAQAGGAGGLKAVGGMLTLLLLAPWAFVGFEIASLETPHFDFPIRWSWQIMACSILSAGFVYISMTFVSASFRPAVFGSWQEYVGALDSLHGIEGVPTFYAARSLMGAFGMFLIIVTALAAILTGVIGAYRATVRMLSTMAEDRILAREFSGTTFCIIFIMAVSSIFTFLGRSTLDWFVELTSLGATIGFAYTSAAAYRIGKKEGDRTVRWTGILGAIISGIFALVQLLSRVGTVETMCAPSFLMLAVWCLLGFLFYWRTMRQSDLSDFDGVTTSSTVLFCLLFYSVLMWFMKRLLEYLQESGSAGSRTVIIQNGIVMLAFVMVGLIVMLYTQRWLRHRHANLEREKMQAEESSKAKSQFLFNMSHDIRTPMNAIIGYTHLAGLEKDVPPKVREYIEKIGISGSHLLALINDVLEMSRIENGFMELENEPGDLCESLQTAFEMFQGQMKEKGIHYTLDMDNVQDRKAVFDSNRFLRILLNLISNAFKFTPGGGSVSVRMTQIGKNMDGSGHGETSLDEEDTSGRNPFGYGVYEICVRDTGIGMSEEFAETVFEAFARERSSTVSGIQGTGLGMAITKSIVGAMQGSIDVETAPGEGTTFTIRVQYPLCGPEEGSPDKKAEGETDQNPGQKAERERDSNPDRKAEREADRNPDRKDGREIDQDPDRKPEREADRNPEQKTEQEPGPKPDSSRETGTKEKDAGQEDAGPGMKAPVRLLVVEDMEINRQILEMLLQNLGYEVDLAGDGREAVDRVRSSTPGYYGAVLMDIQMPVMDGYEATRKIRELADPGLAEVPIIAVTANAFGEDVRKALSTGMNDHIAKPIDPAELEKTLDKLFR